VPGAQHLVAWVGAITALFAATIAVAQFDIKKVLAYSTISQLGFMVAAVGMGAFTAGMFHLVTHAFFKALLFLAAGSVILGMEKGHHHVEHDPVLKKKLKADAHSFDPQDMRNMGGVRTQMKTTFWVYLIGAMALAGIPPLAGFWSKDEILAEATVYIPGVYVLLTLAAFLTAFYMGRQILLVFFGKPRSASAEHASENPPVITVPLIILAVFSALGGLINLPILHTFGHWLEHTIKIEEAVKAIRTGEAAAGGFNFLVAGTSVGVALLGVFLSWLLYSRRYQKFQEMPAGKRPDDPLRPMLGPVFSLLEHKYWVDELYWTVILNPYIAVSRFLSDTIDWRFWHNWFHDIVIARSFHWLTRVLSVQVDLGFIDGIANWLGRSTQALAGRLRRLQTGYVRTYALSVFIGVVIILGYLVIIIR
jgi:NADH-quinone oxidoreductase subunit L